MCLVVGRLNNSICVWYWRDTVGIFFSRMSLISNWLSQTHALEASKTSHTQQRKTHNHRQSKPNIDTYTRSSLCLFACRATVFAMVSWFGRGVEDGFETGPLCLWILSFFLTCDDLPEKMKSERESARKWRKWDGWCSFEEFCSGSTFYCQLLVAFSCFLLGIFGCIHDFLCGFSEAVNGTLVLSLHISLFFSSIVVFYITHTHATHTYMPWF